MAFVSVLRPVTGCQHQLRRSLRCISTVSTASIPDLSYHKETFSKRMSMAGLNPHNRIAIGVSGGPDSMALCVLAVGWKLDGLIRRNEETGFVDGIVGIVVDHKLRPESSGEARMVQDLVSQMGIKCEIACCDWLDGKPKQGHVQEMAREMRYQNLRSICIKENIGVLLIAHHSDDQAELFILRLSRNSGVLGLAGMPFVSQIFASDSQNCFDNNSNYGIILVRPMLDFSKEDMYQICKMGQQKWVEDPTNQSQLYARNRIRCSLSSFTSGGFRSEIQALISLCRLTRSFVEDVARRLVKHSVEVRDHGYVVIDLQKLDPLKVEDLCLSRFLSLILQFISQRHRPIRGKISQALLDYIRSIPCKTSFTAAGCYLCADPQSKGTKVVICCSPDSPLSPGMRLSYMFTCQEKESSLASEIDLIIRSANRGQSESLLQEASVVPLMQTKSSAAVLSEGKRLNVITESTYSSVLSLQLEEVKIFKTNAEVDGDYLSRHAMKLDKRSVTWLKPGDSYHFMSRFVVTWRKSYRVEIPLGNKTNRELGSEQGHTCYFCTVEQENTAALRHMVDADWLYLAEVSRIHESRDLEGSNVSLQLKKNLDITRKFRDFEYMRLSAERAIQALRLIPLPARRAIPVLADFHGSPVNIPNVGFSCCPCLYIECEFKPRVPLGGGYTSYI